MTSTTEEAKRASLTNRYVFSGRLVMQTALHIGGGRATLSGSDSPIVLTPEGHPFIPGSSFKGALRSTVEKLVPSLPAEAGLTTCGSIELSSQQKQEAKERGEWICATIRQSEIANNRRAHPGDPAIYRQARQALCSTCQLFGSPFSASLLSINDLYLSGESWEEGLIQRRDGVAIDRDSETARNMLKYDFEVVPALTSFDLKIVLENASATDLQLISIGLSEFINGFGFLGGKRSRGLGDCQLEDLKIEVLDLTTADLKQRNQRLKDFLLKRELQPIDCEEFLAKQINKIFPEEETNRTSK
jgi:CRISPR-associated RAMP protein, SSO1426 family